MKPDVTCEICGQVCKQQGYANHVRLKHKMKINVIERVVESNYEPELTPKLSSKLTAKLTSKLTPTVITQVVEKTISFKPVPVFRYDGKIHMASDHELLAYYRKNREDAEQEWSRLVERHFKGANDKMYDVFECWSRHEMPELKKIESEAIRRCMIDAERLRSK